MSIYTRRGDTGDTSLADGSRVRKDALRVEAYGTIDEAGCAIGLARAAVSDPDVAALLRFVQQRLMNCAAITAGAGQVMLPGRSRSPTKTSPRWSAPSTPWRSNRTVDRVRAGGRRRRCHAPAPRPFDHPPSRAPSGRARGCRARRPAGVVLRQPGIRRALRGGAVREPRRRMLRGALGPIRTARVLGGQTRGSAPVPDRPRHRDAVEPNPQVYSSSASRGKPVCQPPRSTTHCSSSSPDSSSVLVAYSGGVDSTLLAFAAHAVLGDRCCAVLATSDTYPETETERRAAARSAARIPAHRGRDVRARRPQLHREHLRPLLSLQERALRLADQSRRGTGARARRRRQQRRRPLRSPSGTQGRVRIRGVSAPWPGRTHQARDPRAGARARTAQLEQTLDGLLRLAVPLRRTHHRRRPRPRLGRRASPCAISASPSSASARTARWHASRSRPTSCRTPGTCASRSRRRSARPDSPTRRSTSTAIGPAR